ncbi:MAG: DUF4105 domain-containing protein [Campylobacterota bacterium]|nr:DUF4105 domain-containing protein [Campylobacterota bacterium]
MLEKLQLENLPLVTCKAYDTLVQKIDPQSVTLVFADAHINSPASMFGHTFLRIDSSHESKLVSHAINYAANADQNRENGVVFAIKGLFGGYPGIYSLLPYYEKLKEYKSTEQRDIWEYELNLTPDEVRRMVAHIWELHDSYSWYYFFDENCSYHMLWLLEVARPSVHLREEFWYQVIPPETVFAVEKENLVASKHYRPSKRSILLAYEEILTLKERNNAMALALGNASVDEVLQETFISEQHKAYFLEAAAELCEYYFIENKISKEQYLDNFQAILTARATLGKFEALHVKEPINPDQAHKSSRLRYQVGVDDGKFSQYLGIRAAYQDLYDGDVGMLRGTQIEFFDLLVSYSLYDVDYEDHDVKENVGLELEKLTILSLGSYAQRSSFFQPFSWRMKMGFDKDYLDETIHFNMNIGAGETWGNAWSYFYLMFDPFFYFDDADSIVGVTPSAGAVLYESKNLKTNLEYFYRLYHNGARQHLFKASQLWQIDQNIAIKLQYDYIERFGEDENRFKAAFDYYF